MKLVEISGKVLCVHPYVDRSEIKSCFGSLLKYFLQFVANPLSSFEGTAHHCPGVRPSQVTNIIEVILEVETVPGIAIFNMLHIRTMAVSKSSLPYTP